MPRYQVVAPCFVGGQLRKVGEVVAFDGKAGAALLLLDPPEGKPVKAAGKAPHRCSAAGEA